MVKLVHSRPAILTQRQVDDFARGQPGEATLLLRTTRVETLGGEQEIKASRPVTLDSNEIQEILCNGICPDSVLKRTAAAVPLSKKKHKDVLNGTVPTLKPPECD
jgi:hypothetical protein